MQDKDTIKSTFYQLLKPICNKNFVSKLIGLESISTLIIHAQSEQFGKLRDISNSLNESQFSQAINLGSISASVSGKIKYSKNGQ